MAAKGCAELVVFSYQNSFFDKIAIPIWRRRQRRAGNVIGGGDWALDRRCPTSCDRFYAASLR